MDRRFTAFRYLAYALELLLLFVLQSTPYLMPEILGGKPLLLIPAAMTIAFMEEQIPAMFFGLACGLMLDLGYSDNLGFYTILLTLICFMVGVVFREYMVVSFLNAMAFTSAVTIGLVLLSYLFFYTVLGKGDFMYFVSHYISRIIYTIAVTPLLYLLNKFLYKNLRDI